MIVRKQSIRFDGNRVPVPRSVRVGYESDHLVERLIFEVPQVDGEQSAFLVTDGEYADVAQLEQDADGRYTVDLTAEMLGEGGAVDCWVQVRGADGAVWNSGVLRMRVGELPDADGDLVEREPTIVEQVTQAAQRAEDAAQRTEDAAQEAQNAMKDTARLDDNTVSSESTWSSAELIKRLCPEFSESGNAVRCYPAAGSALGVVSSIEAVQAGSGDPSPENVRLVKGHSAVNLTRSGKNLFDNNVEKIRDYTFPASSGDLITRAGYEIPLPRGKYSASGTRVGTTEAVYVYTYLVQGNTYVANKGIIMGTEERQIVIDVPYDDCNLLIVDGSGAGVEHAKTIFGKVECLLECGETSTEFEPYRGETYTADLSNTVYGGSFDWERGVLTVTHGVIALTGTEGFALNKAGHFFWGHGLPNASSENENNVCSHFIHDDAYQGVRADCISLGKSRIWIYAPRFATLNELKAYLSAQYAAGTPVTVVYRLTEPYEVQLTGTVIAGAEGENVLMSSTGATTVSGRSDPVWVIGTMAARIAALEAAAVNGN